MTWKSYVIVSGVGLVGTYLVSTPPLTTPQPAAPAAQRAAAPAATPTYDIQDQATRLQSRVRAEIEYREPARNPFRYAGRRSTTAASSPAPEIVVDAPEVVPPAAPPPAISVTGIATRTVDGTSRRTAVLITDAGVQEVNEGDAVGADYRVVRIEADAVELAAADGTRRRISLRP